MIGSGYGGGVPPNSGHRSLKWHQPHSPLRFGRKSPRVTACPIVRHRASTARSVARSSCSVGE
ncbi:MAG TPA: hypothetical protein VE172_05710 [Stackebrandtia sp.]|nr:hypothetical protein [Stackebrandtia sp.]HZE38290.1 hypothetical protein [Stackebrandtia sp.]